MKNWTEELICRCLEGVPEGSYRARTEKELEDHLLALCRDLEEAGYAPEEARALAAARMGDPAELARRYVREWRRRLRERQLFFVTLWLFGLCVGVTGILYAANSRNFGKAIVGWWGIAAVLAAQILSWNLYGPFTRRWTTLRLACLVLTVIQLPPILCWTVTVFLGDAFEFSGVMVPGWLGLTVHVLFLAWGVGNYKLLTRFQQEDNLIRHAQSA